MTAAKKPVELTAAEVASILAEFARCSVRAAEALATMRDRCLRLGEWVALMVDDNLADFGGDEA